MSTADRIRVFVTGLGATTPLGCDVASTWSAMLAGRSGVRRLSTDWVDQLPVKIGAPAAVDPGEMIDRVQARKLDRCEQFGLIAAREAWRDAGLAEAGIDPLRLGVVVSSGIGGILTTLSQYDIFKERGWQRVSPFTVPMLMPNGTAGWIGLEFGARAGVHTTVSACASGAEAIGSAIMMIRSGRADVVIAGGTEAAIHPLNFAAFASMRAMSTRNDEPERASRPFDKGRDGFVLGEGAGVVVLESEEHARRRGARIYAEAAGVGYSADSHHIAQPDPEGAGVALAVSRVLEDARLAPEDIVHVNAHATATPQGDVAEIVALKAALGPAAAAVSISATKSMTGHLLGGAGAVEAIATVLTLHHRQAPPTTNLDDLDDDVDLDIVRGAPRSLPRHKALAALNNSFGFGGHNVVVAFRAA